MERHTFAAADSSDIHRLVLTDPHRKFWDTAYDLVRGTYYCLPLFLALAVVVKEGF
jgi:hypothetical protein